MPHVSPIQRTHEQAEAILAPWGPPLAEGEPPILVVQTYGELELEYAAIRRACVLLDLPHRSTLRVTGSDRLTFLNRMVTQDLKALGPGLAAVHSFWLSRKGRIDGDLLIASLGTTFLPPPDASRGELLIDVDAHAAARVLAGLNAFVIADDVAIEDISNHVHRLALHGRLAVDLLAACCLPAEGSPDAAALRDMGGGRYMLRGVNAEIAIVRCDQLGEPGFELFVPADAAIAVYNRLIDEGSDPGLTIDGSKPTVGHRVKLRPAGWAAYNIARIEAGTPVYNIDFGPDSLPAETGALASRVSFTKGCYLGQEIVARMHNLGHPKQQLVALACSSSQAPAPGQLPPQPVGGGPVYKLPASPQTLSASSTDLSTWEPGEGDLVGRITSATLAPMRGSMPAAFAQVRWEHSKPGTQLVVLAEGTPTIATVQPSLVFLKPQ